MDSWIHFSKSDSCIYSLYHLQGNSSPRLCLQRYLSLNTIDATFPNKNPYVQLYQCLLFLVPLLIFTVWDAIASYTCQRVARGTSIASSMPAWFCITASIRHRQTNRDCLRRDCLTKQTISEKNIFSTESIFFIGGTKIPLLSCCRL